ncbi:MAG: type IV toxin-antitoxin system AbiEi family antitoxin domain-containing protein [Dermatophilaceae bacterium]
MDRRLLTKAGAQGGVFTVADAIALGVTGNDLTALVRRGEVIRIRRGAYVLANVFASADIAGRYRLRVLAVMRSRPRSDRASHHSALSLLDIPFTSAPLDAVLAESRASGRRTSGGLHLHPPSSQPGLRLGDLRLVSVPVACVQMAARYGFEAGVCAMDSALQRRRCTREELERAMADVDPRRRGQVTLAIAASEALTESVGETRTRIILQDAGFAVRPQAEIRDGERFLGRVDFLVDDCVVVEFDGLVKYEGLAGRTALAAEKERESRITRLGYEVVRVVWSELDHPVGIVQRVLDARSTARARRAAMTR